MLEQLVTTIIILVCSFPVAFAFRRKGDVDFKKGILHSSLYHIFYVILIYLPITLSFLSIPGSSMNWSGKILGIIFSVAVFLKVKNNSIFLDYLTAFKMGKAWKRILIVGGITVAVMCLLTITFSGNKEPNIEKLIYQLIIPGLDEEIWRGLLFGFLVLILKDGKFKFGHPALWITTLIFALGHSLYFQNWQIGFAMDAFIITGVLGYILGWMTLFSKSILPALIFHNLINFSTNFIEMYLL